MAVALPLVCGLLLLSASSANPPNYADVGRWSQQDIARFLFQSAEETSPVRDPVFSTDGLNLGTVSAVDVDSNGDLFIFHRGSKPWDYVNTFQGDRLSEDAREPIPEETIVKVNPTTGAFISSFGKDTFNVPHGLKIDHEDNIWVTDVGRHQVLRFPKDSTEANLVLGEQFVPGSDDSHFCKPTDVAIATNGDFFVSDGYCNSRVIKFSKDGKFLTQWGYRPVYELTPYTLNLPHGITLIEEMDLVCVADRENARALCYNAGLTPANEAGSFNRTIIPQGDMGKVFGIYYNRAAKEVIAAAGTPRNAYFQTRAPPHAFTYDLNGFQIESWARIAPEDDSRQLSLIHDLCASKDGLDYFLADLTRARVLKYRNRRGVRRQAVNQGGVRPF